ncbi:MAG: hypothetical protein QOK15_1527 [Nocardioidaceae bacterium]|jgi:hypothetical protein|nr:hypothetical protein [Nocardioidaceae bacterium]
MTDAIDLLRDLFARTHALVPSLVAELSPAELLWRPDASANSIAWLVWHLSRVQDDHLAEVAGDDVEQVWTSQGWVDRFALPYDAEAIGYGQTSEEVGAFVLDSPGLLTGYHAAVHVLTESVLDDLDERALDRVVDRRWDPPVTLAVRLVSVAGDTAQHVGQAAYIRGLVQRRR